LRARDLSLRDGQLPVRLRDLVGGLRPELLQAFTGDRLADLRFTNTERNLVQLRERLSHRPVNQSAELLRRGDTRILARGGGPPPVVAQGPSWDRGGGLGWGASRHGWCWKLSKTREVLGGWVFGGF